MRSSSQPSGNLFTGFIFPSFSYAGDKRREAFPIRPFIIHENYISLITCSSAFIVRTGNVSLVVRKGWIAGRRVY